MTSGEINAMPAGREMDALVLEKVMGFKWDEKRCRACGGTIVPHPDYPGCWIDNCSMRPIPKDDERADAIPNYSTDITAAWSVLREISVKNIGPEYHPDSKHFPKHKSRHGLYKPVIQLELYEHDDEYRVTIGRCKGVGMDDDIVAQLIGGNFDTSIPLLICRASLKAVGL